ncbi:MAG: site-specific integrase, partial [Acidimicrobiales bacterium]
MPGDVETVTSLPPEAEEFLLWLSVERGRSPATLDAYRRDLGGFVAYLDRDDLNLSSVNEQALVDYLRSRQNEGLAPSTVTRSMVAVRSLFRFMNAEGFRDDDPTALMELPGVPRGLPKALSEAEVARLIA